MSRKVQANRVRCTLAATAAVLALGLGVTPANAQSKPAASPWAAAGSTDEHKSTDELSGSGGQTKDTGATSVASARSMSDPSAPAGAISGSRANQKGVTAGGAKLHDNKSLNGMDGHSTDERPR